MAKNPRLIDMTGKRFGRLTVTRQDGNNSGGGAYWLSQCDCGKTNRALGSDLRKGKVKSCGCWAGELTAAKIRTHGLSRTRLHRIWKGMRTRCENANTPGFKHYGGRGIRVCAEWKSFEAFRDWAYESGYEDGKSIERIDVDGNYEPANCTWADAQQQSENRRFVARAPDGRLWWHIARESGLTQGAYRSRLHEGWPVELAATAPLGSRLRAIRAIRDTARSAPAEQGSAK